MDGFSSREGIIVLAATNQPDVLDRALLRAGRFDRRVVVNLPDKAGREAIFQVHTRKVPLAEDVDLGELAQTTPGVSGADIRNLVNEAALLAARRQQDQVHHKDFLDALEKIILGPERPIILSDADKERVAYTRAAMPFWGWWCRAPTGSPRHHRAARAGAGRHLSATPDRPLQLSEAYLRAKIGLLGGVPPGSGLGTRTTGAENDIEQATGLARQMVTAGA